MRTLDDLHGTRIWSTPKMAGDDTRARRRAAAPFVLTDIYKSLQRGTVDGVAISWQEVSIWNWGSRELSRQFHSSAPAPARAS